MSNPNILDEVFEKFVENGRIFKDREVLRHDYLPNKLPHREDQIIRLGETVAPVLKGARSSNIFLYGKTGTGKTAVTKFVLDHLESNAKKYSAPVKFSYVNCRLAGTKYRVVTSLCKDLEIPVPFTGLSVEEVFERFTEGLELTRTLFIIVLDEIDFLIKSNGDSLLYEITRINETLNHSKVSLIGISNDLRFKEFLDPRVLSSLSEEELVFRPYDASELRNILFERVELAFHGTALSDGALSLCSALAAAEHGDARRALDLLRVAGEVAERKGTNVIVEDDVREAEKRIEHNRVIEVLKNLTLHSKLVVISLFHLSQKKTSRSTTGEIYDVYNNLCKNIEVTPLTQRRVSTLINELDTIGLLNARVISMGRYGRTKKIRLEVNKKLIKEVLKEDQRLGCLI
ncbi:MAG: ORC1-type DNA replication protein [Candidatus Bathyarchaeota archaeon]|jgi:cell division control protein 6